MLRQVLLHFHIYIYIYTSCYVAAASLALPYIPACYATQKESSTCEEQRVKNREWRKDEGNKWPKVAAAVVLTEIKWKWPPKFSRKNSDAFTWNSQTTMVFVGRKKRSETRVFDKQPAGLFYNQLVRIEHAAKATFNNHQMVEDGRRARLIKTNKQYGGGSEHGRTWHPLRLVFLRGAFQEKCWLG